MDVIQTPPDLGNLAQVSWEWAIAFLPRFAAAIAVLLAGYLIAQWISRAIVGLFGRSLAIDPTLVPVLGAVARYAILILVFIVALGQLGIQTASVLAVVGAAGLAIGLALQGTLSNIAAGLMLLWLRPFRLGDYIETPTIAGYVREIGLFAAEVETFDGMFRFVPNAELWNRPLLNHTRYRRRLFNVTLGIRLDDDAERAQALALETLQGSDVLPEPPPEVFIDTMNDNFAYIGARAWLPSRNYWSMHRKLAKELKARLDGAGIPVQRLLHTAADLGVPWQPRTPLEAVAVTSRAAARKESARS